MELAPGSRDAGAGSGWLAGTRATARGIATATRRPGIPVMMETAATSPGFPCAVGSHEPKLKKVQQLYFITRIENLPSILRLGILSREEKDARGIAPHEIHDRGIVERRRDIITPAGDGLWHYANVFLQPRTPCSTG
jgi:ssDNA thymidine ADP-ribosyltransferase, DarT